MRLFNKSRSNEQEPKPEPESTPPAGVQTAQWTNGSRLGARGISILMVGGWAAGIVGFFIAAGLVVGGGASQATPQKASVAQPSTLEQSAGSFASGFVGAWLGADRDDSSALDGYTTVNIPTLPKAAYQYRDVAVASATSSENDLVQVVVAANVKDDTIDADKGDQWPRRYYQVTVSDRGGELTAVGLPAPVAGPQHSADGVDLSYGESVATNSAAGKTVEAFLAAYLTGQGATEPYTSPSKSIPAIEPVPYSELSVLSLQAASKPSEDPRDGTEVQLYATVTASNSVGQQVTATYSLTLRARADRWEVFSFGTAPAVSSSDSGAATPAASSTPAPTEGN